jgi:hypothetical protein
MSVVRRAWRRSTMFRASAAVCLLAFAVVAALLGLGALENLGSGYQDSATSTYLAIGVPALVAAMVALFAAVRIWRDR